MRQISIIILLFMPFFGMTQSNRLVCELFYSDDGSVKGYPEGYQTYRIYAELSDTSTCLTSVYAFACDELFISAENDIWQHPMGSLFGSDLNPLIATIEPSLIYDSFLTIGKANRDDKKGSVLRAIAKGDEAFTDFEEGKDLHLVDGAWACLRTDQNGYGKRILLAQITTSKQLSYALNVQLILADNTTVFMKAKTYDKECVVISTEEGITNGLLKN